MANASAGSGGDPHELSGVVIGWEHRAFAGNIDLTVQSTNKSRPSPGEVDKHHLLMTRNQALLLAHYLLRLTGNQPPAPQRRGLFARLFG